MVHGEGMDIGNPRSKGKFRVYHKPCGARQLGLDLPHFQGRAPVNQYPLPVRIQEIWMDISAGKYTAAKSVKGDKTHFAIRPVSSSLYAQPSTSQCSQRSCPL